MPVSLPAESAVLPPISTSDRVAEYAQFSQDINSTAKQLSRVANATQRISDVASVGSELSQAASVSQQIAQVGSVGSQMSQMSTYSRKFAALSAAESKLDRIADISEQFGDVRSPASRVKRVARLSQQAGPASIAVARMNRGSDCSQKIATIGAAESKTGRIGRYYIPAKELSEIVGKFLKASNVSTPAQHLNQETHLCKQAIRSDIATQLFSTPTAASIARGIEQIAASPQFTDIPSPSAIDARHRARAEEEPVLPPIPTGTIVPPGSAEDQILNAEQILPQLSLRQRYALYLFIGYSIVLFDNANQVHAGLSKPETIEFSWQQLQQLIGCAGGAQFVLSPLLPRDE